MTDLNRVYIDSCLFINLAKHELVMASKDVNERNAWLTKQFIKAAKDKNIQVLTSSLSIAECTHIQGKGSPSDEARQFFDGLLASGVSGVNLVQPTLTIIRKARDLRWIHDIPLQGALDAIHVASALDRKCGELLTTDKKILNKNSKLHKLGLKICEPEETVLLPDKYRQEDLDL